MVVEIPHLRADAQRNLERILEAAREVFARDGLDASVADVAERAGVGTATIFRRFPTKDDLVAAVLEYELEAFAARAREAAESDDPGAAIGEFMTSMIQSFIEDRCFCEASGSELFNRPRIQELVGDLTGSLELLLQRAQAAGAIRDDVVAADIGFLVERGRPGRPPARADRAGRVAALRRDRARRPAARRRAAAHPQAADPAAVPRGQDAAAKPPRRPRPAA